ncbi:hypothetical protein TNCV_5104631 [Trichonephila clavipes]|nr:hypothetical protein TNCV_5104631 [Trichonephila clavipes]
MTYIQGVPEYWDKLYREVGDFKRIQIFIATHGRKCLRLGLDGVVHKSIGGKRSALPQSFESSLERFTNTEIAEIWEMATTLGL